MSSQKIRVAVLYGGRSGEHEISLQSAAGVVKNFDPERFEIVLIGIDKQGRWLLNDVQQIENLQAKSLPLIMQNSYSLPSPNQLTVDGNSHPPARVTGKIFDVIFPVMHGVLCEDGTIQGFLELMDVPYVGSGVLSSALGMDKDASKRLIREAGLNVTDYIVIKQLAWKNNPQHFTKMIKEKFSFPIFVKPANTGSSVGVHKVKSAEDLEKAIADAFVYDVKVLVEKAVNAREIEISVLENIDGSKPLVSVPGEVVPHHEFYSYTAKYLDEKGAELLIPAPLTPEQTKAAQQLAGNVFEVLECEGMARVDLFLDKDSGEFIFNEINTIPGFTPISMYPKLWEASGLPYQKLLTKLIDLAFARHERKQMLKREYDI